MERKFDLVVLGGGPGGYVAALRASQLNKRTLLIEEDRVGGTCINYGCIPTKYLLYHTHLVDEVKRSRVVEGPLEKLNINLKKMQDEKQKVIDRLVSGLEMLLKKNGVELIKGKAFPLDRRLVAVSTEEGEEVFEGEKIILAAGSRPSRLPFLPSGKKEILTSRQALELEEIPATLLVIGAGVIGLELGIFFHRLGTEVTVLEILPTPLPGWETEIVSRLQRILKANGLRIFTHMKIEEAVLEAGKATLRGTCLRDDKPFEFKAARVLLAAGREPNSEELSSSLPSLELDEKGFVRVDSRLETSISGIYAIGDLIGGKLLAHKASHEGIVAAENAWGLKREMDYSALPSAVFTEPEFSSLGLTEKEAREKGLKIKVGRFPLRASGRALTMGREEGVVKIIAGEKDEILGAHILAPNASELIAEISLAMAKGLKIQDVASTIHIHPTLSEAVMEASLKANNVALHILNV